MGRVCTDHILVGSLMAIYFRTYVYPASMARDVLAPALQFVRARVGRPRLCMVSKNDVSFYSLKKNLLWYCTSTRYTTFNTSYNSTVTYAILPMCFPTLAQSTTPLASSSVVATCPNLGHSIENGNASYTRDPTEQGRYVENTTLTVSCDDGYRGGGDVTCQNGGNWSPLSLPSCRSEPDETSYNNIMSLIPCKKL